MQVCVLVHQVQERLFGNADHNKKSTIYGTSDQSVSYDLSDLSNLSESG